MNIVIIEDEIKAAKEIKEMIHAADITFNVVVTLPSVQFAIEWFNENPPPHLIFSDIQLSDGLSFEIFQDVKIFCPVIFITAFDEYAIQAFEANGIDYLLKPVEKNILLKSVMKFKNMKKVMGSDNSKMADQLETMTKTLIPGYRSSILVFENEKIIPIKVQDIAFIHSAGGLIKIYNKKSHSLVLKETLDELESLLDPSLFFRVNRQYIINKEMLNVVEFFFNRRLLVKLNIETPDRIIVSKEKASLLLEWIERG